MVAVAVGVVVGVAVVVSVTAVVSDVVGVAVAGGVAVGVVVVVAMSSTVDADVTRRRDTLDADDVCTMLVQLLTALARPPAPVPAPDDECDAPSIFGHPITGLPGAA